MYKNRINNQSSEPISPNYITDKNVDENISKLSYLLNDFDTGNGICRRLHKCNKSSIYKALYQKYKKEKKSMKSEFKTSITTKNFAKEYTLTHDIDFMKLNQQEILRFTDRLHYLLSEATTALELIKEDITSCYESKMNELKNSYEVELASINSVIQGVSHYKKAV